MQGEKKIGLSCSLKSRIIKVGSCGRLSATMTVMKLKDGHLSERMMPTSTIQILGSFRKKELTGGYRLPSYMPGPPPPRIVVDCSSKNKITPSLSRGCSSLLSHTSTAALAKDITEVEQLASNTARCLQKPSPSERIIKALVYGYPKLTAGKFCFQNSFTISPPCHFVFQSLVFIPANAQSSTVVKPNHAPISADGSLPTTCKK